MVKGLRSFNGSKNMMSVKREAKGMTLHGQVIKDVCSSKTMERPRSPGTGEMERKVRE